MKIERVGQEALSFTVEKVCLLDRGYNSSWQRLSSDIDGFPFRRLFCIGNVAVMKNLMA